MYGKQVKTATGTDSWVMAVVWLCMAMALNTFLAPWFSLPELAYRGMEHQFTLWSVGESIALARGLYGVVSPEALRWDGIMLGWLSAARWMAGVAGVGLVVSALLAYGRRQRAVLWARLSALLSLGSVAASAVVLTHLNGLVNLSMGRSNTFWNLTVFSSMQLTGFACAQGVVSLVLLVWAGRMLDTQRQAYVAAQPTRRSVGRRTRLAVAMIFLVIPLLIAFGILFLKGRSYYFISLCVIGAAMLPFLAAFEDRRPQARELVLISSLVVIATAGRAVFFMLPHFKPVTALVIVAGIGLGAEAGFLTGALTGFVSNFLFGQGPWTPWQMFAFGVIGFLAGLFFEKGASRGDIPRLRICGFGWVATVVIYGLLLDTSTALSMLEGLTWNSAMACYVAGLPVNITHGCATAVFLYLVTPPMLRKIGRIRHKYGWIPIDNASGTDH